MPKTQIVSRRSGDRVGSGLSVSYGVSKTDRSGLVGNISEEGLYIDTDEVYRVGTRLLLRIEFPDRSICQHGEVAWAIGAPAHMQASMMCGMGISFIDADPSWPEYYRRWKAARVTSR